MTWVKTALQIVVACIIPNIGGFLGSLFTATDADSWYGQLNKPVFNPPNWLFFPAWTILYITQGYASYRVWKAGNGFTGEAKIPLIFFAIQLILNWIWTPIFFGLEALLAAFIEIIFLWVFVAMTAILFFRVDKIAGLILVPYLGWITFASILNFSLWQLNK